MLQKIIGIKGGNCELQTKKERGECDVLHSGPSLI